MGRVMSVAGGKNLVIQTRNDAKSQQWSYDQVSKTIRSVQFGDLAMDVRGTNAYAYKSSSVWYQMFKYNNGYITNEKG
jgi:hypothetical protein